MVVPRHEVAMSAMRAPSRPTLDVRARTARRVGHAFAIPLHAGLLWVVHQLGAWGWPRFLTEDVTEVLGLVTVTLVASMLAEAVYVVRDRGRIRAFGEVVTATLGVLVGIQLWVVFPFDFTSYAIDWTGLLRVALLAGIVGSAVGLLVHAPRIVTGRDGPRDRS